MTDDQLQRIQTLFERAADLGAAERAAFLATEAADDAAVRERVAALVEQLDRGDSLGGPFFAFDDDESPLTEGPGTVIDRYKLLQRIGEGGFGVVYMAEQTTPVVRKVALKIIKLGMDTKEVVARFEAERQALAMMDHPHIAKVLDGGATTTGRPYFVMELVRGPSITEYGEQNRLDTRARLELFEQVCHAVQHAHQKGVIHRDIKPSNVLVTLHDGRPVPKVIDFGIAKAMHARLTEKTLFTEFRHFIGTPAYMSPEQAEMSALDIDTRTDIYSLGVLLFELLTGTTPLDTTSLVRASLDEIKRAIRDVEPPRPSQRISTSDEALAHARRLDRDALSRQLRGDLDWIVLKSLEKERARRYDTAKEFASDIRRHLEGLPVLAGPPTAAYRIAKFLGRNRAAVVSTALIAFFLVAGIIGTSLAMIEAGRQRDEAVRSRARLADKEREAQEARREETRLREVAQRRATESLAVVDFLDEALALADPEVALDPDVSVETLLDRASTRIAASFDDQPAVEARIRRTIGRAYNSLGRLEPAWGHLRRASELTESLTEIHAIEHYKTLWTLTGIAFRLDRDEAFSIFQWARRVGHGHVAETHPDLAAKLERFSRLAEDLSHDVTSGGLPDVFAAFDDVVREAGAAFRPGDARWPIVFDTYEAAGYTLWHSPLESHSIRFFEEAHRLQERELTPSHPRTSETLSLLVGVLNRSGRAAEAEALIRDSIAGLARVYPAGSWQIAFAESMLGECLANQRRHAEAEPWLTRADAVIRELWSERNFYALDSAARLVNLYEGWGKEERAEPYRTFLARGFAISQYTVPWSLSQRAFGPDVAPLKGWMERMEELCGVVYGPGAGQAQSPELASLATRIIAFRRERIPASSDSGIIIGRLLVRFAMSIAATEASDVRERLAVEGLAILREAGDVHAQDRAEAVAILSDVALATGRGEEAVRLAREASEILQATFGRGHWTTASARIRVARGLLAQRLFPEAELLLVPSCKLLTDQFGPEAQDTKIARALVVELYTEWGRPEQAAPFR